MISVPVSLMPNGVSTYGRVSEYGEPVKSRFPGLIVARLPHAVLMDMAGRAL